MSCLHQLMAPAFAALVITITAPLPVTCRSESVCSEVLNAARSPETKLSLDSTALERPVRSQSQTSILEFLREDQRCVAGALRAAEAPEDRSNTPKIPGLPRSEERPGHPALQNQCRSSDGLFVLAQA